MKRIRTPHPLLLLAAALVLLSNAFLLGTVWMNRTGEPTSGLTLTERELSLPYRRDWRDRENSGLALQLLWHTLGRNSDDVLAYLSRSPAWLDAAKLRTLGFDAGRLRAETKHLRSRHCYIVLEYDGDAYRTALAGVRENYARLENNPGAFDTSTYRRELKMADIRLKRMEESASRLFAVDAGTDPDALRRRYPDRARYLVVGGVIRPLPHRSEPAGFIASLDIERLHVPLPQRRILDTLPDDRSDTRRIPRYDIDLVYGSRFAPRIVDIRRR